jgi:hypothetical protein
VFGSAIVVIDSERTTRAGGSVRAGEGAMDVSTKRTPIFSGPPSNKMVAGTLAAMLSTFFWTLAVRLGWFPGLSSEDLAQLTTMSTMILALVLGFFVPESAAFTAYNEQRLAERAAADAVGNTRPLKALPAGERAATVRELSARLARAEAELDRLSQPA